MTNERTSPTTRRSGLAIGLSAGLISGAAAGMILGVPGLTSAASSSDVAVSALQETDTEPTTDPVDETSGETMIQPTGDRLREQLDALVDDGTITAEQADIVADHLVEQTVDRLNDRFGDRERRGRRLRGQRVEWLRGQSETVTELLGVDSETIRAELDDGATLAEIAEDNGVSTEELVDAIVADAVERADAAVESGRIEQDVADERLADLEERVTERVTTPRGDR